MYLRENHQQQNNHQLHTNNQIKFNYLNLPIFKAPLLLPRKPHRLEYQKKRIHL